MEKTRSEEQGEEREPNLSHTPDATEVVEHAPQEDGLEGQSAREKHDPQDGLEGQSSREKHDPMTDDESYIGSRAADDGPTTSEQGYAIEDLVRPSIPVTEENMEHRPSLAKEEDEEEDEEDEMIVLDPEHPLVRRFQTALKSQLSRQLDRINMDLREKSMMVKAEARQRQEVGEELYRVQEQLARLQAGLEDHQQTATQTASDRRRAQEHLEVIQSQYRSVTSQVVRERTHVSHLQGKVENVTRDLFYIREADTKLRGDFNAMRNATRKAHAERSEAEEYKYKQDLYVERLTKDMERVTEQIGMYEAQTAAQSRETQAAKEALSEAQMEIESLAMEHKQLLQQWDSSLAGMRKQDEALTAKQEVLRTVQHQVLSLEGEIDSYRKSTTKEQEQNELLTMQLNRAQLDADTSSKLIGQSQAKQEALQVQYCMYHRTLQETENCLARLNTESGSRQAELSALRKQMERESGVRLQLEDRIMTQMQQELVHDKAAKHRQQLTSKMAARKKDMISQLWQLEAELAAVGLESGVVSQRLDSLAVELETLEQEIAERNRLLNASQATVASCVIAIDRKQAAITSYNKKIEQIAASTNAELSPLQVQAQSLSRQLEELVAVINKKKQLWMWQQGVLVALTQERQASTEKTHKLQTQFTILQQRRLRTEGEIEADRREQAELEKHMKMLRGDMLKLNTLLSKNGQLQQTLQQENTLMETHFLHGLKEAERDSVEMQMRLEKSQEEKERLVNSLVEAQRQIMLWEKKTQLARETRSAVDADVAQGDICTMKAEIHRMEVRYGQLLKEQEQLIRESEATVSRRENLVLRRDALARGGQRQTTHSQLTRTIQGLRRNVQDTHKKVSECEQVIKELQESQVNLSVSLSRKNQELSDVQGACSGMTSDLLYLQDTKEWNFTQLVTLQSRSKHLQAVREGRYTPLSTCETVEAALQRQKERVHAVSAVIHRVCQEFPQHQGALRRLTRTLAGSAQATVQETC